MKKMKMKMRKTMNKIKWIKCNLPYGPIYQAHSAKKRKETGTFMGEEDSFSARKLNVPGTLIKTKKKYGGRNEFLIGDINELRGVCDDCVMFDKDAVVVGYCKLTFEVMEV